MDTIVLRGGPAERGVQQGRALRDRIVALWERYEDYLFRQLRSDDVERVLAAMIAFLQRRFPEVLQELDGVARGAGMSFDTIAKLNFGSAIWTTLLSRQSPARGCSCVAFADTPDGAVIGKNTDLGPQPECYYALKAVVPEKGIPYLGYGEVGGPWVETAVNADGLCIGQASSSTQAMQEGHGIPILHSAHLVMQYAGTTRQAVEYLAAIDHAGKGINLMIADRSGEVIALERAHDRQAVRTPRNGVLYFANHFVSEELKPLAPPSTVTANSAGRLERYRAILEDARPDHTAERIVAAISDHGGPVGPCQHGDEGMYTRYACLLLPRYGEMRLFRGPACSTARPESYFV